ncbi:hypothetical protein RRF57_005888 [Xylaria bambusicola]|uniref:Pyruvate carboxyltransferase domain-containing protein n=1 Tax=Xylaria bambusicola TaxID=326684 RepID=A0AAN7Z8C4_9PEZI
MTQNAHSALEAGATHIDTSVLGIGERNGITPLGALMARMIVTAPEYTKSKYNLKELKALETLVANIVQIDIPYNNVLVLFLFCSQNLANFGIIACHARTPCHESLENVTKTDHVIVASVHSHIRQASTPRPYSTTLRQTYEIINPEDFGLSRYVCINSRVTGWNAVRSRADKLGLYNMSDDQIKQVLRFVSTDERRDSTAKIKKLADIRPLGIEDTDSILRSFHRELQAA